MSVPPRQAAWTGGVGNAGQVNQFQVTHATNYGYQPSVPAHAGVDPSTLSSDAFNMTVGAYTSIANIVNINTTIDVVGVALLLYTLQDTAADVSISITKTVASGEDEGNPTHPILAQTVIPSSLFYFPADATTYPFGQLPNVNQTIYVPMFCTLSGGTSYAIVVSNNLLWPVTVSSVPYAVGGYYVSYGGESGTDWEYPSSGYELGQSFILPLWTDTGGFSGAGLAAQHLLSADGGQTWTAGGNPLPVACGFLTAGATPADVPPTPVLISEDSGASWTFNQYSWPTAWNAPSYTGATPRINTQITATARSSQFDAINYLTIPDSTFNTYNANWPTNATPPQYSLGHWSPDSNTSLSNVIWQGLNALELTSNGSSPKMQAFLANSSSAPYYYFVNQDPSDEYTFTLAAYIVPATPDTTLRNVYIGYSFSPNSPVPNSITYSSATLEPSATLPNLYTTTFTLPSGENYKTIMCIMIENTNALDDLSDGESHIILGAGIYLGNTITNFQPGGLGIGSLVSCSYNNVSQLESIQMPYLNQIAVY